MDVPMPTRKALKRWRAAIKAQPGGRYAAPHAHKGPFSLTCLGDLERLPEQVRVLLDTYPSVRMPYQEQSCCYDPDGLARLWTLPEMGLEVLSWCHQENTYVVDEYLSSPVGIAHWPTTEDLLAHQRLLLSRPDGRWTADGQMLYRAAEHFGPVELSRLLEQLWPACGTMTDLAATLNGLRT